MRKSIESGIKHTRETNTASHKVGKHAMAYTGFVSFNHPEQIITRSPGLCREHPLLDGHYVRKGEE